MIQPCSAALYRVLCVLSSCSHKQEGCPPCSGLAVFLCSELLPVHEAHRSSEPGSCRIHIRVLKQVSQAWIGPVKAWLTDYFAPLPSSAASHKPEVIGSDMKMSPPVTNFHVCTFGGVTPQVTTLGTKKGSDTTILVLTSYLLYLSAINCLCCPSSGI